MSVRAPGGPSMGIGAGMSAPPPLGGFGGGGHAASPYGGFDESGGAPFEGGGPTNALFNGEE